MRHDAMTRTDQPDSLTVAGSPLTCGRALGQACAAVLRERVTQTVAIQRQNGLDNATLDARTREFTVNLRHIAPHWLDEVAGMAAATGLEPEQILMLNCLPSDFYSSPTPKTCAGNCTSFIAIGDGENRLFKIRDERNRVQSFHTQTTDAYPTVQIGRDVGNIGCAHFLNQHGVAGANNTGSHTDRVSARPTLNDCHTLRYFAENATCVDDVPRLYRQLIEAGVAGGAGKVRGAIYVLADPRRGLILECVEDDCVATFVDEEVHVVSNHFLSPEAQRWWTRLPNLNTSRRKQRMEELLRRCGAFGAPERIFAVSRDRKHHPHSLCNDDSVHFWMTISAQLHIIDRSNPAASTACVCCGNTRHSLYVPVPITETASFLPLLDGRFYQAADTLYRKVRCSRHFSAVQRKFEHELLHTEDHASTCRDAYRLVRNAADAAQ